MLTIRKIDDLGDITKLKKQYFAQSSAPLDGMWHFGFVPMSDHFAFYQQDDLVGYCCINAEGYMLQFYLSAFANAQASAVFRLIAQQECSVVGRVNGAFVSTAETPYLSLCLDNSSSFTVNALMYQLSAANNGHTKQLPEMALVEPNQLDAFVTFASNNIAAPEQWLSGYFRNLIRRRELWGLWRDDELLATGECRVFDEYQTGYAELGMIVAKSWRCKGIATKVLKHLIDKVTQLGLQPICSTEFGNLAAQTAITRAGLISTNRIIQFEFECQ